MNFDNLQFHLINWICQPFDLHVAFMQFSFLAAAFYTHSKWWFHGLFINISPDISASIKRTTKTKMYTKQLEILFFCAQRLFFFYFVDHLSSIWIVVLNISVDISTNVFLRMRNVISLIRMRAHTVTGKCGCVGKRRSRQ